MSSQSKGKLNASMIIDKQGIFGFGLSHNNNLDFMIIVVLAGMGIIIKLFFPEKFSRLGNTGPATSTIWGYGLTAIALSIMLFMGIYVSKNIFEKNGNFVEMLFSNVSPIFFTLLIIMYAIFLNFQYFKRINSNRVTNEYHTYSFMSSVLTIVQIGLVTTYLFYYLSNTDKEGGADFNNTKIELSKNAVYILSIINFLFLMMINISLQFFSTDETPIIK
jgi:ABC-type multidrug transport system fused ATPase/permease subunit